MEKKLNKSPFTHTAASDMEAFSRKVKFVLALVLSAAAIVAIVAILFAGRGGDVKNEDTTAVVDVNGIKMKLESADKQIASIKEKHPEIDKCTFDQKMISCTDVAGDTSQYQRQYLQDFAY